MLTTHHRIHQGDARDMRQIDDASVQLVVTSPPYPMIAMWDEAFSSVDGEIAEALAAGDGDGAFDRMHAQLDDVWRECFRVLEPGGLACVNVGDATRNIGGEFRLFSNHARILRCAGDLGFSILPDILWRKPTNAPNKFLGSGMLPAGAYVTYEHEYVLILRKGGPRPFTADTEKARRRRSAFFWEERNGWFSDVWLDLKGTTQPLTDARARARSAAFPFELPWRLIHMHSLIGDTVLDPFLGTGTTLAAALAAGRHGIGYELDAGLVSSSDAVLRAAVGVGRRRVEERLAAHARFVSEREAAGKPFKHRNRPYGFPVITRQEAEIELVAPTSLESTGAHAWVASCEPVALRDRTASH